MNKSAADVEQEVEASRGSLDRTVEALKGKMTPTQIFDEIGGAMGGAGNQILEKFIEQAKENPMPLAVMGVGLAWLMSSSKKKTVASYPTNPATTTGTGGMAGGLPGAGGVAAVPGMLADKVHDAAGVVSSAAASLGSGVSGAMSSTRDTFANAGADASERLGSVANSATNMAGQLGDKAQQTFTDTLTAEPLIIGAIGLAVGMALGTALPSTTAEDRLLGPMHDRIVDKGKAFAQEHIDTVKGAATAAFTSVKDEISHQGGSEGAEGAADKVGEVAKAAVQAVQDQFGGKAR